MMFINCFSSPHSWEFRNIDFYALLFKSVKLYYVFGISKTFDIYILALKTFCNESAIIFCFFYQNFT